MIKVNDAETEISEAEVRKMIDDAARVRLGISGDEMLARYRKGELADPSSVADLIALADLLVTHVAA